MDKMLHGESYKEENYILKILLNFYTRRCDLQQLGDHQHAIWTVPKWIPSMLTKKGIIWQINAHYYTLLELICNPSFLF